MRRPPLKQTLLMTDGRSSLCGEKWRRAAALQNLAGEDTSSYGAKRLGVRLPSAAIHAWRHALVIICILALVLMSAPSAEKPILGPSPRPRLLACLLHSLPTRVQWPRDTFSDEKSPFIIGIVGDDPFAEDEAIASGTVRLRSGETAFEALLRAMGREDKILIKGPENRPITRKFIVKRFPKVQDDIAACHLLFVSSSADKRLAEILKLLGNSSVLTVGESPEFIDHEGVI